MPHYILGVAARALVGEPAIVTGLQAGLTRESLFNGQPFSRVTCLAANAGGESISINVPGAIAGLTPNDIAQGIATLSFARVKFNGLTIEVKGEQFNRVVYTGTADSAVVVPVTAPTATTR